MEPPTPPTARTARRSPYLPTSLEVLLIGIYPATLVLGSLYSLVSPQTRNTPYSATLQSHPPDVAPSYFARKRNVFNTYFVKIGWFWMTLAVSLFLIAHPSLGPPARPVFTPRRARLALRYTLVTAWWIAVTQWFFGPPLIDTLFRFTGGQCELLRDPEARADMSEAREVFTHAACTLSGGEWKGGHDISGHVFLLVLGSAMLALEILPTILRTAGLRDGRTISMPDGKTVSAAAEAERETHAARDIGANIALRFVLGIAALSWWMLLMTAVYFHTWFEKITGLFTALLAIYAIYFLPRAVPALRAVIGMPGV